MTDFTFPQVVIILIAVYGAYFIGVWRGRNERQPKEYRDDMKPRYTDEQLNKLIKKIKES